MNKLTCNQQSGFTVLEMLITISIVLIVSAMIAPQMSIIQSLRKSGEIQEQLETNRIISSAMLEWAEQNNHGLLPDPYTGNGVTNGVYDDTSTDPVYQILKDRLLEANLAITAINYDGKGAQNVRVFQMVPNNSIVLPTSGASGELATVTYDVAAIYTTKCPKVSTNCNPSANGVPGDSAVLNNTNLSTWAPAGDDYAAVRFTTLGVQKKLLTQTIDRVTTARDAIRNLYNALQISGNPNSATNYFPTPNGTGATSQAGHDASQNQGCYDGWYDLSAANVNILQQAGLTQTEFSKTAWGGSIEYCRDYDATGSKTTTVGSPPYAAALRIHQSVSQGIAPGNTAGDNLFFAM